MRSAFVALLVASSALLDGCADSGDDHGHFVCADGTEIHADEHPAVNSTEELAKHCPKTGTGTRSATNTTTQAPNVLPTLVLTVTDDLGNATLVTLLDGNLTFSAAGSSDPDGRITGIAVSVTDSNTTRTASLFDPVAGTFQSATFNFDRPGIVNVTVAMVDDRAGFVVNQSFVYVNQVVQSASQTIMLPRPVAGFADCGGSQDVIEAQFYKEFSFPVMPGATLIQASDASSSARLTICNAADESLSGAPANPTQTTPGTPIPPPVGIETYYVAAHISGAAAQVVVAPLITIHYEPQEAAPAAE
jgi:hypothetical protein